MGSDILFAVPCHSVDRAVDRRVFEAFAGPEIRRLSRLRSCVLRARWMRFAADVTSRLRKYGRSRRDLVIMAGVFPVAGRTQLEADERFEELQALIDPIVGLSLLSKLLGFDLSDYPIDGPLPVSPETNASASRQRLLSTVARQESLTVRELYLRNAGSRGHFHMSARPSGSPTRASSPSSGRRYRGLTEAHQTGQNREPSR